MAFFKFRQRGQTQPEPAPTPGRRSRKDDAASAGAQESIDTVRRRARHRLLGAVVLVGIAVVGFPLLFDTQPRPIAVNAPIIIPDKDAVGPLRSPDAGGNQSVPASASLDEREEVVTSGAAAGAAARAASAAATSHATRPASSPAERATADASAQRARQEAEAKAKREAEARAKREAEARAKREEEAAQAKRDQAATPDTASTEAERRAKAEQEARAKREADAKREAESKRLAEAKAKREAEAKAKRDEAARARALLEGRSASQSAPERPAAEATAAKQRFIVQVGAFADDAATRQARQKAEAAGVKTYTQVVDTSAGKRTRVRVGPFASREEAEKAAAALKKAGLGGAILGL